MLVRSLGWIIMITSRAQSAGQRIFEILDAESAVKEKPNAIDLRDVKGHVRFENVSFGYDAISPVQKDVFLFSATIRDNIAYGAVDATQEAIEDAAKAAYIHDFIMGLPNGYDTWVGERGITLSGGQKQRIAIARTLLRDPRILILDDSTSSVDTETE